jgi:hypothetical protein
MQFDEIGEVIGSTELAKRLNVPERGYVHGPTRSAEVIQSRTSGLDATYVFRGVATNSVSGWIVSW